MPPYPAARPRLSKDNSLSSSVVRRLCMTDASRSWACSRENRSTWGPPVPGVTMKLCVNTLLGLGMQALAEAITLGLKAGLQRERLLEVLGGTVVLSPSQKSKLENVLKGAYPPTFPLRLMFKDFGLILDTAMHLAAAMPITAAAQQVCAVEFGPAVRRWARRGLLLSCPHDGTMAGV